MNYKPIASKTAEFEYTNGSFLFSHQTPVVAMIKSTGEVYVTNKVNSRATTTHINEYLKQFNLTQKDCTKVKQEVIDNLWNNRVDGVDEEETDN